MKKGLAITLACVMGVSLIGCSTPGKTSTKENDEKKEKVFRYSMLTDVTTLDPQKCNELLSSTIGYHIGEGLTRSIDGEVHSGIAESWDVSEDGLTYTFHLRDAKYSDGETIKAQDFEYAMKRLVDPETASTFAFIAKPLENADEVTAGTKQPNELGVKAVDDKTLECTLGFPAPYFLQILSMPQFYPTRQEIVEEYENEFAANGDKNVYSGPFCLKEWKQNDGIILEKNPEYWDKDAIHLDRVEILIVSDENTALAMFESGELDYVNVPTDAVANYADAEFYKSGAEDFIKINTGEEPMSNRNFRLALNYGLNRKEFIKLSTNDVYEAAQRFVLPEVGGVEKTFGEEYPYEAFPIEGDVDLAKEYLAKAMEEMQIGDPCEIEVELLTSDTERTKKEAEVIQALLQDALGITIHVNLVPRADRLSRENSGNYQMVVSGIQPDYPDPISFLESWETTSPYNHTNYSNPDYDALLQEAYQSGDAKHRMDTLAEAEKVFMEDGGLVPLQYRRNAKLVNKDVTGITNYFCGYDLNFMYGDVK